MGSTARTSEKLIINEVNITYWLAVSALYIFFIGDAINKLLLFFEFDFNRISIFFRIIYEIFFFFIIILFSNRVRTTFLLTFLIAFFIFLTGQIVFAINIPNRYDFVSGISIFNKYYFLFIIYYALLNIEEDKDKFSSLIKHFEWLLYINSIAVIIGFIFQIEFLRTYVTLSSRYGYSGFIPAQNEATMFFFISVSFFYYKHFILEIKSRKIYLVLVSALLLGTKGIYLFLAMLILFHFLNNSSLKTKLKSMVLVVIIFYSISWFLTTNSSKVLLDYFTQRINQHGLLYVIASGRNLYIENIDNEILNYWSLINYFVGGQDQSRFLLEMDFFDLFFFLGLLGSVIYLLLYFSSVFRFKIGKPFNFFFVVAFFGLAFFGGHFFASAVNALYLCMFSMYIYATQRKQLLSYEENTTS